MTDPRNRHPDRFIYDNRVTEGSVAGRLGAAGFASIPEVREQYFAAKFNYYADKVSSLVTGQGGSTRASGVPGDVLSQWDMFFADELKAYVLRILQIDKAVVHDAWYPDIEPFQRWAQLVTDLIRTRDTEELSAALDTAIPICIEEELSHLDLHNSIGDTIETIASIGENSRLHAVVASQRLRNLVDRVLRELANLMAGGRGSYYEALTAIASVTCAAFEVSVCDILLVTEDVLDIFATSTEEVAIDEVKSGESAYALAGGITGSALLLDDENASRWILTNVLSGDPRQSEAHRELYVSAYGEDVDAFAVFPVFEHHKPIGVIRLIQPRKLDQTEESNRRGRPGTWPIALRMEMAAFCAWISSILPLLRAAVPGSAHDSALAQVAPHGEWLDWAPPQFKAAVLRDSAKITNIRDEHRYVGCTMFIGTKDACREFAHRTAPFPAVPVDRQSGPLAHAVEFFARIVPGTGVFVIEGADECDVLTDGCQYNSVQATGTWSPVEAAKLCKSIENGALVHVDGEARWVRVYEEGRWSADYFVNEKTGEWQLRVRKHIEKQIAQFLDLGEQASRLVQGLVREFVVPYSYTGHGGLVLVSRRQPKEHVVREGFRVGTRLWDMSLSQFTTVAAVDGGTWISIEDEMVKEGGTLYENEGERPSVSVGKPGGGSRHATARTLANLELGASTVIVISANRRIILMQQERSLEI